MHSQGTRVWILLVALMAGAAARAVNVPPVASPGHPDVFVGAGAGAVTNALLGVFRDPDVTGTCVRMDTPYGPIDLALRDVEAPNTVSNFLNYVRSGRYNNSIVHRAYYGFLIQGGGIRDTGSSFVNIVTDPPVVNEFNTSNVRGTIAMARQAGVVNSATSQWFINRTDNVGFDSDNGGFTVFGRVVGTGAFAPFLSGMDLVDAIGDLPHYDLSRPGPTPLPISWANPLRIGTYHPAMYECPLLNYVAAPTNAILVSGVPHAPQPTNFLMASHILRFPSVYEIPAMNFSVLTNTATGVVQAAVVSGSQLRLTFGTQGVARVTLRAVDLDLGAVTQTFAVAVGANGYEGWRMLQEPAAGPMTNDSEGDGRVDLMEYALQSSPWNGRATNEPVAGRTNVLGTNFLTLSFTMLPDTRLQYRVEGSARLTNWTTVWARSNGLGHPAVVASTNFAGHTRVTVRSTNAAAPGYLRLRVEY
jgi:cyclophilin family peptidyl-prolyl cis-trans isomerase